MTHRGTDQGGFPPHRYRIFGAIHRGGMGEILLAQVEGAQGFSRRLVLKGLLPELCSDSVSRHLFYREARLMARLEHPNIVRVFDVPEIDDKTYLAMEYVRGRNLHQVIQKAIISTRPIPVRVATHVVAEALRGLHYAHRARDDDGTALKIVHRDVSPGNILLSFFGEVKDTDFGIAKMADMPSITGPRMIRGKARYSAPECVHGEEATPQSDLYAATVVLAESLTGMPLFEKGDISRTLVAIVSEPRSTTLDRIFARIPDAPGLREVFAKGLALDPSERFASAIELAEVLEEIGRSCGGAVSQTELGKFMRDLFCDAPDRPSEERLSGPASFVAVQPPAAVVPDSLSAEIERALQFPTQAPRGPISEPVSYPLAELVSQTTDEETAQAPADRAAYAMAKLESRLVKQPPWLLIIAGILIGAATAIFGSILALLTAG